MDKPKKNLDKNKKKTRKVLWIIFFLLIVSCISLVYIYLSIYPKESIQNEAKYGENKNLPEELIFVAYDLGKEKVQYGNLRTTILKVLTDDLATESITIINENDHSIVATIRNNYRIEGGSKVFYTSYNYTVENNKSISLKAYSQTSCSNKITVNISNENFQATAFNQVENIKEIQNTYKVDLNKLQLYSFVDENLQYNEPTTIEFRAEVNEKDAKNVTIVKEDGTVLTTLNDYITEGDTKIFYGSYTFTPQDADYIKVMAFTNNGYRFDGYISISEKVTDEDADIFAEVTTGLGEYIKSLSEEYLSNEELLDKVETWLKKNKNVINVRREDKRVYYKTKGGIESYFTVEKDEFNNKFIL